MLKKLIEDYQEKRGEQKLLKKQIKTAVIDSKKLKKEKIRIEEAHQLLKQAANDTQKQLEYFIEDFVTTALNAVMDDKYKFVVRFGDSRGKTTCNFYFEFNGHLVHPFDHSGLGAADIAALALRVLSWKISQKYYNYRNLLILDEPFNRLKGREENKRAIELLKDLSQKLDLQIITISDERASREDILQASDKLFLIKKIKNRSEIQIL